MDFVDKPIQKFKFRKTQIFVPVSMKQKIYIVKTPPDVLSLNVKTKKDK